MKKVVVFFLAIQFLVFAGLIWAVQPRAAECGDVDSSGNVTASDALAVLKAAVGGPELNCGTSRVALANRYVCPGGGEYSMGWENLVHRTMPEDFDRDRQDFTEIEGTKIQGTVTAQLGNCGRYHWNLYAWSREYLLPGPGDIVMIVQKSDMGEPELVVEIPATRIQP